MTDLKRYNHSDRLLIVILFGFIALYFYKLGFPSIWNPNEAFYVEVPREMIENGDLLTPYFNYEFRFQKPPLMYWLVVPFQYVLGLKEISARIVSVCAAIGGVFSTYWFGTAIWSDKRAGIISALILAAAFDYNTAARYGSPEMLLTFLVSASLIIFYKWHIDTSKYKAYWLLLFYVVCGFSTLTKGPVGIILPALIISVFYVIKKDVKGLLNVLSIWGIILYLLISLPWYLIMVHKYGKEFYDVVMGENVSRYLSRTSGTSNYFFYFGVLPWNFFPGSVFMIPAFLWLKNVVRRRHAVLFPLIWFSVVFVFFSISKSKLPTYIYPLFAPLAVITGGWIHSAMEHNERQKKILVWLTPLISLTTLTGILWIKSYLPEIGSVVVGLLIFLLAWSIWNIKEKKADISIIICLFTMIVFIFSFLSDIIPQIEGTYRNYRELATAVKKEDPGKRNAFYSYGGYQQNLSYYLERKVVKIKTAREFHEKLSRDRDTFFLLKSKIYDANYSVSGKNVIWRGLFYRKSESRFMRYLTDIKNGKIDEFVIIR